MFLPNFILDLRDQPLQAKKYEINTQIICEILQVRTNPDKTGSFFLRLTMRKEKKEGPCKNNPMALAINRSNSTVSKPGTAPAELFSCLKLSSVLKRNRGRDQQGHTRRECHAWMPYRVFQAQLRSPALIKMLMHILYTTLATCCIILRLSVTGDGFFSNENQPLPAPNQQSVLIYPRVLFPSSRPFPCISLSPKSARIENCKHFTLHVPLQVLDEGPVYSTNIALIHSSDFFSRMHSIWEKNRKK